MHLSHKSRILPYVRNLYDQAHSIPLPRASPLPYLFKGEVAHWILACKLQRFKKRFMHMAGYSQQSNMKAEFGLVQCAKS